MEVIILALSSVADIRHYYNGRERDIVHSWKKIYSNFLDMMQAPRPQNYPTNQGGVTCYKNFLL